MDTLNRYRKRFDFWLDLMDDAQMAVAEQIQRLKNERAFAATIRDGIMLMSELRQGRVDLLLRLFPDIADKLKPSPAPQTPPDTDSLRREIEQLKQVVLSQSNPPNLVASAGPKAIAVPQFDRPLFDDDTPELLAIRKDTSTKSAQNFLASMAALNA